jgi:1-acyl-sn-glycerol-3-phosphate acyltransferase
MDVPLFRSIWVLSFYGVSTALLTSLSLLVSIWSEERARALARVWAKVNLRVAGIKVEVEGKENLPISSSAGDNDCGFIIAANHTSAADIFAILAGLRLDICWVSRASLLRKPFMGWHLGRLHIPLARGSIGSAKRFIQEGTCKLDSGAAVVVFPEGTWREDEGPMLPFKKGSKKGIISLRIGSPIDPEQFTDLDQIAEETYRAITELLAG